MHPLKQNLFLSKIQTQDNTYEINITTKTISVPLKLGRIKN